MRFETPVLSEGRERNLLVFHLCILGQALILMGQYPVAGVLDDFGDDVTKKACQRDESFVGREIKRKASIRDVSVDYPMVVDGGRSG